MNKKTITSIALSIIFGVGAILIARNWLDENKRAPQLNQKYVAVATMTIPIGTVIESKHISLDAIPASMLSDNTIETPDDIYGLIAKETIYSGDIIRSERLYMKGEGNTLASLISDKMRAVSIRVDDVVGVAGFLLPGNRVDILNTIQINDVHSTEAILTNIKILAIDQRAAQSENTPQLVRAVTVEVNIDQAEILMTARSRGTLQLALRNPIDTHEVVFLNNEAPITGVAQQKSKLQHKVNKKHKVEVIRGVTKESVQLKI